MTVRCWSSSTVASTACPRTRATLPRHALERYRAEAADLAKGLLGDFVIIVLDRRTDTLLVARDPVGVRPWYLASANGDPIGASDIATLVALPGVDGTIDETTVIHYLAAVTQSRGPTVYRAVTTLRPGQTWLMSQGRSRTLTHHRWQLDPDLDISWDDAAARCRDVLERCVQDRLDVMPSAATADLSGGLDSSIVVGTMARLGAEDLLAGRLVFEGRDADERRYSDAVAEHWGIPLVSAPPWLGSAEECLELTRRLKRPVPDPHFTMFTTLHETLAAHGRLDSLTGSGGDDAFAVTAIGGRVVERGAAPTGDHPPPGRRRHRPTPTAGMAGAHPTDAPPSGSVARRRPPHLDQRDGGTVGRSPRPVPSASRARNRHPRHR